MTRAPNWWSEKPPHERDVVQHLSPVRLVFDTPLPVDEDIDVILLPEPAVWRVLRQLVSRPGRRVRTLGIDPSVARRDRSGCVSQVWHPGQVHLGGPASQYVARVDGVRDSGPLWVTNTATIERRRGLSGGVDLAPIGVPVGLDLLSENTMHFNVFVPVDPAVELLALTPSTDDPRFSEYLDGYLGRLDETYELGDALRRAFNEEHEEYLANEARLTGTLEPSSLELAEGEQAEVVAQLSFERAGRSLFVIVALDRGTGDVVAAAELVGVTIDDDGTASVSF